MKFNDLTQLLEQDESIFKPRKLEDRKIHHEQMVQRQVQDYIKNGSEGDLNLHNTPITSLPAGLKVGWNLYLINTPIKSLPAGLTVGGSLYLINTPITSLPAGLKVGGDLWLNNTPIAKEYTAHQLKQMCPGIVGEIIV